MQTTYTKVDGSDVAYGVMGDGPIDLLFIPGEYIPVDMLDEEPRLARALRRLSSMARVIAFNRRGVGLSDLQGGPPTHEQCVEDALAVMDAAQSERAVVFGSNVSGPASILFASLHPDRTSGLILVNTTARYVKDTNYDGWDPKDFADLAESTVETGPAEFDFLTAFAPSVANDTRFRTWWDQAGHRGASPTRSRQLWQLLLDTDVREALPIISAPTLVATRPEILGARTFLADQIPGARYVALPGRDLIWWVGEVDAVLDEIETFLGSVGGQARAKRKLATVLFIDVVRSTERAVELGDRRWRDLLGTYHELVNRELARRDGRQIGTSGDGVVATFEMPADAVRCAEEIARGVGALDIDVRAGVHTGEIEILEDDVAGIGVHIAARVMSAAHPGEVLVSRTVCDLVIGSGLSFESRGTHELKGVPGTWELYALSS